MSDTRRAHLDPKRYAGRRPKQEKRLKSDLKTPKQRRAAERRSWRKEL